MTREEAISKLRGLVASCPLKHDEWQAVEVAIEALKEPKQGEWIPCAEKLPEEFKEVLVWYEYYSYKTEKLKQTYGIGYVFQGNWMCDVYGEQARCIAWMPLPEPYKGGDEK